jgi:hypothetical protein
MEPTILLDGRAAVPAGIMRSPTSNTMRYQQYPDVGQLQRPFLRIARSSIVSLVVVCGTCRLCSAMIHLLPTLIVMRSKKVCACFTLSCRQRLSLSRSISDYS